MKHFEKDLISVIVPIYNTEEYLAECIESIIKQSYDQLEVILVDDGSNDNSSAICDEYAQKDSRIRVLHKRNGGPDSARKAGISIATGRYVAYVDSDDWIEPNMYEKLHYYARKYNVLTVESGIIDFFQSTIRKRIPFYEEGVYKGQDFEKKVEPYILYTGMFYQSGISGSLSNKLFDRNEIFLYQQREGACDNVDDDTMCAIPCVAHAKSLYVTHDCYYHYRVRRNSIKRNVREGLHKEIVRCYAGWHRLFSTVSAAANIEKQIDEFFIYVALSRVPAMFDNKKDMILRLYGGVDRNSRIVLYGAGPVGISLKKYLDAEIGNNLIYWADKRYLELKNDLSVNDPQKIRELEFDYVIIAIALAEPARSARRDLLKLGIPDHKILWVKKEYIDSPRSLIDKLDIERIVND